MEILTLRKKYYEDDDTMLLKGNCITVLKSLPDKSIDMIFADPPYFLSNNGTTCKSGKLVSVNKGKWDKSKSFKEKHLFNKRWLHECYRVLKDTGTIWISGTFHNIYSIGVALEQENYKILNNITWQKSNPPPNLGCRCFTHSTETIIWAKKNIKKSKHYFNYKFMKEFNNNKQMKDVWSIDEQSNDLWKGSTTKKSEKSFGKHPTQKPLYLLEKILMASTEKDNIVLDCFMGSGTTGVAAKKMDRIFIGIEKEKEYLELAKNRIFGYQKGIEMRNFDEWLLTMNETISSYGYYVDFDKVYLNVEKINIELNLLNSLLGKKETIKQDFIDLANRYPEIIKIIPLLIAVRKKEIKIYENDNILYYNFSRMNKSIYQYADFLEKIGIFELFSKHKISNLKDYMLGIEVGLDSNARKNRGGHLMEDIVENYLKKLNIFYDKEIYAESLSKRYGVDLSPITNSGKSSKRFDFSFSYNGILYVIETNFYSSSGSKLNETARSYKMIAQEANNIPNFKFIWITDGIGWNSAKKNLRETFDDLPTVFNLNDLKNNSLEKLIYK